MRFRTILILLSTFALISLACTLPTPSHQGLESESPLVSNYPDSPEGVVHAFLIAYQEDADNLAQYVIGSSSSIDSVSMLNINGMIMSFIIQSASVRPDPPRASVEVGINLGEEEAVRVFNLSQKDGRWAIVSIERFLN